MAQKGKTQTRRTFMHACIQDPYYQLLISKLRLDTERTHKWSGGEGGGVLCQLWCRIVSVMCAVRPSTCLTTAKSCLTILYLNCNCCSQFAYHHVITQTTVSHFVSNIFLLYHAKQHPLWPGLGGRTPTKSIPVADMLEEVLVIGRK
jgi:hypothetical protein